MFHVLCESGHCSRAKLREQGQKGVKNDLLRVLTGEALIVIGKCYGFKVFGTAMLAQKC